MKKFIVTLIHEIEVEELDEQLAIQEAREVVEDLELDYDRVEVREAR